ncbi:FAD-binding oxidoreductase [Cupriavidus pinatubonensis]|uniref:FAD-binding oxidoreductase n=1 Tax=Cupriavidus pinatubonensis TaxID=248026 RepID=UPI001C73CE4F|nr:FAD-binding oxidoreductase [Cupriavidus pinatubonensis]QYY29600.1 FAD-binding oxidoreductase [Cupriavidus pinatubonensis]
MSNHHVNHLISIVGPANVLVGEDVQSFATDYRGVFRGQALAVVRPASTAEVSAVVAYCNRNDIPVVPQGGNTSLLGGSVPDASGTAVLLSLTRLNQVRSVDSLNATMVVEAGVTLHAARAAAEKAGALFPLRIGSEGSCQIGGNLSTNAGGTAVLRYGNMRDLVLGLEVVLPNGEIWNGLRALRKDNAGYDLKHLFIGAEGTLGIITAAVLKMYPIPRAKCVAMLGSGSADHALEAFGLLRQRLGTDVTAFELISSDAMTLVLGYLGRQTSPLPTTHPWYVLVEMSSTSSQEMGEAAFYSALGELADKGMIDDAVIASNEKQATDFWLVREEISDAQTRTRGSVRCDISVPLSSIPRFIRETSAKVMAVAPATRMVIYGHVGDGNVHFNPLRPADMAPEDYLTRHGEAITKLVDDAAMALNGSISAEHGIGAAKCDALLHVRSQVELKLAWRVKRALDPANLMNPAKVLPLMPAD